jgi:hypothetical protein
MTASAFKSTPAAELDPPAPSLASQEAAGPRRFTLDGDPALEAHLGRTCRIILSGIRGLIPEHRLEALFLGGGYGRGEGGVLRGEACDRPYNDLEFYVAIRGIRHLNQARYHRRLEVLAEILTHFAGVELEFKITSLDEIRSKPVSMFSYDLASGHRLLWSRRPADLTLLWERHRRHEEIPLAEATRLLMNRCSGLLFARAELERGTLTPAAADFVRRNIAKAQLACGDALLVTHGQYHWSCRERHRRLAEIARSGRSAVLESTLPHHAAGVDFKLHPTAAQMQREALESLHREVTELARTCWLEIESLRLGRAFSSTRAYVGFEGDKCPGSPAILNAVLNLHADGMQGRRARSSWRHPRGRIYHSLVLLLWEPEAASDAERLKRLEAELGAKPDTPGGWVDAYRSLWSRVQ